ncbi:hypothetical protein D6C91_04267 [Aureobasidium pullulans]|uniref:Uncharacterized protein n=1 Tax=Aureobasidium pullulans TaxID=5580 RepID=A0A4S9TBB9_AURPU|nr:hypothetical protein D6C91_04267 [Aureobasidium pullulans]
MPPFVLLLLMAALIISTIASTEQNVLDDNEMALQYRHTREEFAADLAAQKPLRTSMSSVGTMFRTKTVDRDEMASISTTTSTSTSTDTIIPDETVTSTIIPEGCVVNYITSTPTSTSTRPDILIDSAITRCVAVVTNGTATRTESWFASGSECFPPAAPSPQTCLNAELLERAEALWKGHTEHDKLKAREKQLIEKEEALLAGFQVLHESMQHHEDLLQKFHHHGVELLEWATRLKEAQANLQWEKNKIATFSTFFSRAWMEWFEPLVAYLWLLGWEVVGGVWAKRWWIRRV